MVYQRVLERRRREALASQMPETYEQHGGIGHNNPPREHDVNAVVAAASVMNRHLDRMFPVPVGTNDLNLDMSSGRLQTMQVVVSRLNGVVSTHRRHYELSCRASWMDPSAFTASDKFGVDVMREVLAKELMALNLSEPARFSYPGMIYQGQLDDMLGLAAQCHLLLKGTKRFKPSTLRYVINAVKRCRMLYARQDNDLTAILKGEEAVLRIITEWSRYTLSDFSSIEQRRARMVRVTRYVEGVIAHIRDQQKNRQLPK